jgi:hypothetical protein
MAWMLRAVPEGKKRGARIKAKLQTRGGRAAELIFWKIQSLCV